MDPLDFDATPAERFLGERLDKATALLKRAFVYVVAAGSCPRPDCPPCTLRKDIREFLGPRADDAFSRLSDTGDAKGEPKW